MDDTFLHVSGSFSGQTRQSLVGRQDNCRLTEQPHSYFSVATMNGILLESSNFPLPLESLPFLSCWSQAG